MRNVFIRYQAKPEKVAENRAFVADVFAEVEAAQPEQLRYMVLEFEDGSFVHFAFVPDDAAANPLRQIAAFERFQANSDERRIDKPSVTSARIVGNYRMLAGTD